MTETIKINATKRVSTGTANNRRSRHAEQIPGVLYGGNNKDNINLAFVEAALRKTLTEEFVNSSVLDLNIDGQVEKVILQSIQRHPANSRVMHLDFLRVEDDRKISIRVPLRFINEENCYGVRQQGGAISHSMVYVEITCLPQQLPKFLEVDVKDLRLAASLHLSDIQLPEGVVIKSLALGKQNLPIVTVNATRGSMQASAEGEDAAK